MCGERPPTYLLKKTDFNLIIKRLREGVNQGTCPYDLIFMIHP